MGTKNYDDALDLITFSRASGGTSLRRVGYGAELVTNGTFDTDSDWNKGSGWTISGGTANASNATSSNLTSVSTPLIVGRVYRFEFTILNYVSGGVNIGNFGADGIVRSANGTFVQYIVAAETTVRLRAQSSFTGSIDNISVKEVIFDRATDDLVLFNHPDNIPRIDYAADGTVKGLLIEEARTNLLLRSEIFTAGWVAAGVAIGGATVSPAGLSNATELVESATSGTHIVYVSVSGTTSTTLSVYAKASTRTAISIACNSGASGNWAAAAFNLSTGSAATAQAAGDFSAVSAIENVGSGWYRCSLQVTSASANVAQMKVGPLNTTTPTFGSWGDYSYTGDGTSGIYIWGAQAEAGSFPTSYIPTSGATATRAADIASIPVTDFGYNQKAGTVVVEFDTLDTALSLPAKLEEAGVTTLTRVLNSSGSVFIQTFLAGTAQASLGLGSITSGSVQKVATSFKTNDFAGSLNGGAVVTDNSGTLSSTYNSLGLAQSGVELNGHIKSLSYYPRKLTSAQLQELTA